MRRPATIGYRGCHGRNHDTRPRGVVARASTLSSRRSILVPSAHRSDVRACPLGACRRDRRLIPKPDKPQRPSALPLSGGLSGRSDHERPPSDLACAPSRPVRVSAGRLLERACKKSPIASAGRIGRLFTAPSRLSRNAWLGCRQRLAVEAESLPGEERMNSRSAVVVVHGFWGGHEFERRVGTGLLDGGQSRPRVLVLGGGFAGVGAVQEAEEGEGRCRAGRPARLPHLPAAPLSARDRLARDDRRRALPPRPRPRSGQHHGPPRQRDGDRPRRARGAVRRDRATDVRLPRPRTGRGGQLLRRRRGSRARVPDVHAAARTAPQGTRARALGGGRQGPEPRRRRRAQRRRRGRRADRRRDGGRAGRALSLCIGEGLP